MTTAPQPPAPPRPFLKTPAAWLVILGVILIGVSFISGLSTLAMPGSTTLPQPGKPISDIRLVLPDGSTQSLKEYRGQVVLLNTWATWCPPCQAEMPALSAYQDAHQSEGFTVLAINVGEDRATAVNFALKMKVTFPIFLDSDERLADALGIADFPTSILIGRDGTVLRIHVGRLTPAALEEEITPYLK